VSQREEELPPDCDKIFHAGKRGKAARGHGENKVDRAAKNGDRLGFGRSVPSGESLGEGTAGFSGSAVALGRKDDIADFGTRGKKKTRGGGNAAPGGLRNNRPRTKLPKEKGLHLIGVRLI